MPTGLKEIVLQYLISLITLHPQKNRSDIPCYWESQTSGCLKPHCSFLHTKPRVNDPPPAGNASGPPPITNQVQPVQPGNPHPAAPLPPAVVPVPQTVPSLSGTPSITSQAVMRIPTLSSTGRPRPPISMTRLPPTGPYPTVGSRPMLVPQPPHMIRTPQFTGPPRPSGIVQPVSAGRGFPPVMPSVPMRYGRGAGMLVLLGYTSNIHWIQCSDLRNGQHMTVVFITGNSTKMQHWVWKVMIDWKTGFRRLVFLFICASFTYTCIWPG